MGNAYVVSAIIYNSTLSGVWSHPSISFPTCDETMWIDEGRRRILSFVTISVDPVKRVPMRVWYEPESPTTIRAGLRPGEMPRTHAFRFEGDTLIWTFNNMEYAWRRLSIDQYPEWLDAQVSAANVRMGEMEKIR